MIIKSIAVSRINPAPYNPRVDLRPGDERCEKLKRSIDEFGCVEPLVWNKRTGHLVGGHQRFKVLLERRPSSMEVSVVDLPLNKEKALNLALNKIVGDWDQDKLAELLDELIKLPDFDLDLTGFDLPEAKDLIAEALGDELAGRQEDFDFEAELAKAGPVITRLGDEIGLGDHRLLCGDCTDVAQVERLMQGERAALFATDPPYLVGYDGTNHPASRKRQRRGVDSNGNWSDSYGIEWDDADADPALYERFIAAAVTVAIRPNCAWYCFHASRRQAMVEAAWEKHGAFVHQQIIWAKQRPILTRSWYAWKHEPCFFGWLKGKKPPRTSAPMLSTVWQIDTIPTGADRPDHPTPKPLEVFEIPMLQHTRRTGGKPGDDLCYEPFAGSGTQIIAAERLGRRCFGIEISPRYCDLIVRRYIAFAGEGSVDPKLAARYRRREGARERAAPEVTSRPVSGARPTPATRAASRRARTGASR